MLKNEGLVVNRKRTYGIYRQLHPKVRTQRHKKLHRPRIPMSVPDGVNRPRSVVFVCNQLASGRRFRVFNIVDHFSRECVVQITDFSISGKRLVRELDQLARTRPLPGTIVLDNASELASKAMFFWSRHTGVILHTSSTPAISINDLLEQHNPYGIDLLCVDCEGMDFEILSRLKFDPNRLIKSIIFETSFIPGVGKDRNNFEGSQFQALLRHFNNNNYQLVFSNRFNAGLVHQSAIKSYNY